jgi:hemoglobin/transferrin/lactoferrin receptor protein
MEKKLMLITGGRIDRVWIRNEEGFDVDYLIVNGNRNDSPPTQRLTFEEGSEQSYSWSANAGLLYQLGIDVDASLNLARSFRAPSLEERFKYIDLGNVVLLGDPALDPESGYSADLGIRVWNSGFTLQSGIFINSITNMIAEVPGEFIFTLTSETKPDTLPALISTNLTKALLYGFDFRMDYNFYDHMVLFVSGAYVRGKNTDSGDDLPRIPPLNGRLGFRYTYPKLGSAEISVTGAAKQDKIAEGERITDGYSYLDMALHTRKFNYGSAALQFFTGIDNVTNESYTNHLSTNRGSVSIEPGRNFFIRISVTF